MEKERMEKRDKTFLTAVETMREIIDGMNTSAPALGKAVTKLTKGADKLQEAAGHLAEEANSISNDMERNFGDGSPLLRGLDQVVSVVESNKETSSAVLAVTDDLKEELVKLRDGLESWETRRGSQRNREKTH